MTGDIYKAIEVMVGLKVGEEPCCPHPLAQHASTEESFSTGLAAQVGHRTKVKAVQSPRQMEENLHFPLFLLTAQSSPQSWLVWHGPSAFRAPARETIPLGAHRGEDGVSTGTDQR